MTSVIFIQYIFTGTTHVDNELYLSKALEKLGSHAMSREGEPDIGAAFIKFSIVAREVSSLMKTLMQSLHNIIMFPVENLLKGDLRGVKGLFSKQQKYACEDPTGSASAFLDCGHKPVQSARII